LARSERFVQISSRLFAGLSGLGGSRPGYAKAPRFSPQKGYGFIAPQGGGKDAFVHISAVEKAGLNGLNEGQVVEYEGVANKGKTSAENLKVSR
jgi:CspA family cold shock protein